MSRIKSKKQGVNNYLLFTNQDNQTGTITFNGSIFTISKPTTFADVIKIPNGTAAAPSLMGAATNSGVYFGSGTVGFSTAGTERVVIDGQGDINVYAGRGIDSNVTNVKMPWIPCVATDDIAGNVGGAIPITTYCTTISSDAGGDAFTLTTGSAIGQLKKIKFYVDGGGDAVVTGAFAGAATTLTFSDAGEFALLMWDGTDWIALELGSDLTLAHAPVIA